MGLLRHAFAIFLLDFVAAVTLNRRSSLGDTTYANSSQPGVNPFLDHDANGQFDRACPQTVLMAHDCLCQVRNECSCDSAIEFMTCISGNCGRDKCTCQDRQFQNSCAELSHYCPSVGLTCTHTKATCQGRNGLRQVSMGEVEWEGQDGHTNVDGPETYEAHRVRKDWDGRRLHPDEEVETSNRRPGDSTDYNTHDETWKTDGYRYRTRDSYSDDDGLNARPGEIRTDDGGGTLQTRNERGAEVERVEEEPKQKKLKVKLSKKEPEETSKEPPAEEDEKSPNMEKIFVISALAVFLIIVGYALYKY